MKISEITDEGVKSEILDKYRHWNVEHLEWYEFVFEDAKEAGKRLGIDIDNIYFSGFSSQGDGACFEGDYRYEKQSVKKIRDYAPLDKELAEIAQTLQAIQRPYFYQITAGVKHRGHYNHENCTVVDVYNNLNEYNINTDLEDAITDALRDFMRWIYKSLEREYNYLTSDEAVAESLDANEYDFEFNEDGDLVSA